MDGLRKLRVLALVGVTAAFGLVACSTEPGATTAPVDGSAVGQEPQPTTPAEQMEVEMEQFVSVTEFFSLGVPAGWSSTELVPGGAFVMANSQAALDRYQAGEVIQAGDLVINVGFLPYRLLETNELRALNFQFDATPDVFLQSLMPMFRVEDGLEVSAAELVSLNDELDAGQLTVSDAEREGIVLMFPAGDRVIALVSAVAASGEMAQFEDTTYAVASGLTFSGAQDALYGALLGG